MGTTSSVEPLTSSIDDDGLEGIFRRKAWLVGKLGRSTRPPIITVKPVDSEAGKTSFDNNQNDNERDRNDHRRSLAPKSSFKRPSNHAFTYTDTSEAWKLLRDGGSGDVSILDVTSTQTFLVRRTSSRSVASRRTSSSATLVERVEDFPIPYVVDKRAEAELTCTVCQYYMHGYQTFPCRVCLRSFHERCLNKKGIVVGKDSSFKEAHSVQGWSCPKCEDISSLLREDEMLEIVEAFDKLDADSDTRVSVDEFVKYQNLLHKSRWGTELSPEDMEMEKIRFTVMDRDKTGTIEWWEFLNYETIRKLRKRDKMSLVMLLTENEIQQARDSFQNMDKDLNGSIDRQEAQQAFKMWYNDCFTREWLNQEVENKIKKSSEENDDKTKDDNDSKTYSRQTSKDGEAVSRTQTLVVEEFETEQEDTFVPSKVGFHVEQRLKHLLEGDMDADGKISWPEYLKDQALPLISNRRNGAKADVIRDAPCYV